MRTKLKTIIERLRIVSDLEVKESRAIEKLYGATDLGIEINSESAQMIFEPAPCVAALYGFLDSLPKNALSAILVLMYGGRDGDKDMFKAIDRLEGIWNSKDHTLNAITEKFPRIKYIDKGIERLGPNNLNKFLAAFPEGKP